MNRIVSKVGFASLVSLALVSEAAQAHTNTHGAAFHAYNGSEHPDIDYISEGVRNLGAGSRNVVGAVGFHPAQDWAGGLAQFYVDGKNAAGKSTTFTLTGHNWDGTVQSTVSFNTAAASYDIAQSLNNLTVYSYVSLLVFLPSSSSTVFRGVTVVQ